MEGLRQTVRDWHTHWLRHGSKLEDNAPQSIQIWKSVHIVWRFMVVEPIDTKATRCIFSGN